MIHLIIVEDHQLIRSGLKALLKGQADIIVVGETAQTEELNTLLSQTAASLVLLNLDMPENCAYKALAFLKEQYPEVKVLVVSSSPDERQVRQSFSAGAMGYLIRDSGRQELISAIRLTASGHFYICSDVALRLLCDKPQMPLHQNTTAKTVYDLSKRELEVLSLICNGLTNAEIADKLFTSRRTIEKHRQHLLSKTNTHNTATLVKWALQHELVS